jgi:hypothetical protein
MCSHSEYLSIAKASQMVAGDGKDIFGRAAIPFLSRTVPRASKRRTARVYSISLPAEDFYDLP